jgi:adenosylcobyric acid synthase
VFLGAPARIDPRADERQAEVAPKPTDGAVSPNGLVMGCYLHGIFADDDFRRAFLSRLREGRPQTEAYEARVETTLDALAEHLEANCDLDALLAVAERGV